MPVFLFLVDEYPSYEILFFDDDSLVSFGVSLITCWGDASTISCTIGISTSLLSSLLASACSAS